MATLKRMQVLVAFMMSMCGGRIALPRSYTLTHSHQLGAKQGKFHQRSDNFYCGRVDTGVRSLLVKSSRIEIVRLVFSPLQRPGAGHRNIRLLNVKDSFKQRPQKIVCLGEMGVCY